jgi:hypothetical protein
MSPKCRQRASCATDNFFRFMQLGWGRKPFAVANQLQRSKFSEFPNRARRMPPAQEYVRRLQVPTLTCGDKIAHREAPRPRRGAGRCGRAVARRPRAAHAGCRANRAAPHRKRCILPRIMRSAIFARSNSATAPSTVSANLFSGFSS